MVFISTFGGHPPYAAAPASSNRNWPIWTFLPYDAAETDNTAIEKFQDRERGLDWMQNGSSLKDSNLRQAGCSNATHVLMLDFLTPWTSFGPKVRWSGGKSITVCTRSVGRVNHGGSIHVRLDVTADEWDGSSKSITHRTGIPLQSTHMSWSYSTANTLSQKHCLGPWFCLAYILSTTS